MSGIFWFLLLVFIVGGYFWIKSSRRLRYEKLSPTEKLWEDYKKLMHLSDEGQRIGNEIESLLVAGMTEAKTPSDLLSIKANFLEISYSKKAFWSRAGSSLERVFLERSEYLANESEGAEARTMRAELDMQFADNESRDNKAIQL